MIPLVNARLFLSVGPPTCRQIYRPANRVRDLKQSAKIITGPPSVDLGAPSGVSGRYGVQGQMFSFNTWWSVDRTSETLPLVISYQQGQIVSC